jgi:hypothetical protein
MRTTKAKTANNDRPKNYSVFSSRQICPMDVPIYSLSLLLPDEVLTWMENHAKEDDTAENEEKPAPYLIEAGQRGLKEIPKPEDFPVLLAAR